MTGKQSRTATVSIDDRARVPFAIIGVLMLVSSVMIVGILQTRGGPETEIDETLAMDRTEAAVQSELRGAVVDATQQAAAQPVTTSELDALEGNQTETFETYLELLIYLEAQESLPSAGQTTGDVETTVSIGGDVPDDPDRAVSVADDRIDVTERTDGDGLLEVTLDRVTITLEEGGRVISERTVDDLTVTVGTPILELQEKTEDYEAMLNEDFFEGEVTEFENLAQKTAMRLYPMAYFKSFINRMDNGRGTDQQPWTFDEVLDNNHTEVMTNDAIFGVQEEVFGEDATDPYADRVMRPAWACLTADMLETMTDSDDGEETDKFEATVSVINGSDNRPNNGVYDAAVVVDGETEEMVSSNEVSFDLEANETHSVNITVIKDGYKPLVESISLSERNARETIELQPASNQTIGVFNSNGEPVQGADVNIWPGDGLVYATTNADGEIDLEALDVNTDSELTIEIFAEDHEDYSETVDLDRSHNVVLTSADGASLEDLENSAGLHSYFEDDPSLKDAVCEDFRKYLFGDKEGELPDAPTLDELLTSMFGEMNPVTKNETIEPNDMADIAYYEMIGINDLSTVLDDLPSQMNPGDIDEPIDYNQKFSSQFEDGYFIDTIYDVEVERSTDTSLESLPTNTSNPFSNYTYNYSRYNTEGVTGTDVWLSQDWQSTGGEYTNRDIHSLNVDVEIEVQETSIFENSTENGTDTKSVNRPPGTVEFSFDIDINANLVDEFEVAQSEIEADFEAGNSYSKRGNITGLSAPDNYEHVIVDSLETLLDVNSLDPDGALDAQIEDDLNSSISISSIPSSEDNPKGSIESDIRSDINGGSSTSYDFDDLESDSDLNKTELRQWLKDDLYMVNAYVKKETDTIKKPRIEFLRTPSPFRELGDKVEKVEDELVQTNSYDNVPDLIRMEVRKTYFDTLTGRIDEMAEFHEETVDDVDDAMSAGDGALDDSLDVVQEVFAGNVETGSGDLEGSDLMDDMGFDVSGSPTYMDLETVNDNEVPSVRPPNSTVMDNDVHGEHAALGVKYGQRLPTPGLPLVPWPPMLYVLQVNSYNVDIQGEYSRFEVSATAGDPVDGERTTYVRDRMDVEVGLGGNTPQKIGEVEPIEFDTSLEILIAMPGMMPMKSGAPPNAGDPTFGNEIGLSKLLAALEEALGDEETATLVPEVSTTWYNNIGSQ